ncbi:hypothetical protein H2203_006770 [Taxawa tesnikishii (nom. ined.)]|nr:hypothetical protein H2203_006770 [Dothideales sp. JES 119]
MAISSINRHSIPWRTHFSAIKESTGEEMTRCINLLHENPACYEIPIEPARWNRKTAVPPPKRLTLAPVTIIVVPGNLCSQWQAELRKHTLDGALNVLVMKSGKQELPPANQLMGYDVILFSRSRFEQENRDGSDDKGRRMSYKPLSCTCPYIGASRTRDCTCLREEDIYDSPLKHLHFLRIIIDEGHFFSSSNSVAAQVAEKLVTADHRWVVSGTPAKDLLGVEMDLVAADSSIGDSLNGVSPRQNILNQRRDFSNEDITGAVKSIGSIASHFLKVRPWAPDDVERPVDWESYIYRHEDLRKRTFSGFSHCLRRTLESLVVRTRPEDVERDIELPPLIHTTIRLEPSLYDKMTTNLFTLVLTANAVTSERTDADYLFHKSSARARYQLVHNLRQSAFFWTGFSEADIIAATQSGETYLEKDGTSCSLEDRMLLEDCINKAQIALSSTGWKALSRSHEIGLFVEHWPDTSVDFWTFDQSLHPMLVGVTQLLEAQQHVNRQASSVDPTEGLSGAGIRALAPLRSNNDASGTEAKPALVKMGIPSSGVTGEPMMKRRSSSSDTAANAARKASKQSFKRGYCAKEFQGTLPGPGKGSAESSLRPSATPDANTAISAALLPPGSDLLNTRIVGTTSAKLSYLVSRILKYHREEKILVFYDGDNIAYYVAQVLELFHIHHLIYAKSLTWAQRSDYVVKFDQDSHFRVLLMDVKQAAFGLNLSSASRVFFVNPVCRPDIEAQAIKRAHRIGQTRPVVVETLILVGTIEEQMFERAKRMTRAEHKDAKMLEDDGGIKDIIQCAKTMTIDEWETSGYGQLAVLEEPQQLWSRSEWPEWIGVKRETMLQQTLENIKKRRLRYIDTTDHNDTGKIADPNDEPPQSAEAQPPSKRVKRTKRPRIVLNDVTNHNGLGVVIDAHEDVLDPALFSPEDASQASASQSTLLNGNASTSRTSRSSVVRTPELLNNSPALSPRHYSLFGGPS